jgi:site-specific DNA recombinase
MKLAGYLRVSTHRQSEGFSLKAQKEAITSYCKAHKHELISLEAESKSALKQRPVFEQLYARLLSPDSKLDGLIVAKLDRLDRSVQDLVAIVEGLHKQKKQFISVQDAIDTSTRTASSSSTSSLPLPSTSGSCSWNAPSRAEP